jgi:hypothetical protein
LGIVGLVLVAMVVGMAPWFGVWVSEATQPPATAHYPYNDYAAEIAAVRLLDTPARAGFYDPATQLAWQRQLWGDRLPGELRQPFVRVPWTVLLLWPLAQLPHALGFLVMSTLSVVVALAALITWARWARLPVWVGAAYVCAGLGSLALLRTLILGQHSALLLGAVTAAVLYSLRQAGTRAGLALAAGTLKPHLIMLIPLAWLLEGRWRALLAGAGALAGLALLSIALLGPQSMIDFVNIQSLYERYFPNAEAAEQMQNWRGLIESSFGWTGALGQGALTVATIGTALLVAAAWWPPGTPTRRAADLRWAVTILGSLLFSTHLHFNDLLLWAIPAAIVLRRVYAPPAEGALSQPARQVALAGVWIAYGLLLLAWFVPGWRLGLWFALVAMGLLGWQIYRETRAAPEPPVGARA